MNIDREQITDRIQQLGTDAADLSRNMWLAGLGVVGTVDERRREIWDDLVARGRKVETPNEIARKVRDTGERMNEEVKHRVKDLGDRVERGVEEGMTEVLHRFGVPSRNDVQQLIDRVERLTQKVEGLSKA